MEDAQKPSDSAPLHLWLEVIGALLLLIGSAVQYFGEEGRALDTLPKEQRQEVLIRPGMLEIIQKKWSPAKKTGAAVFIVGAIAGIVGIVVRLGTRKPASDSA
jgi:hypothetical protein